MVMIDVWYIINVEHQLVVGDNTHNGAQAIDNTITQVFRKVAVNTWAFKA